MEYQCGRITFMARITRAASKARTRQRLLDEADRLFRERGYTATSLEQIAEAADVTKGAIYGHFSSKEDLLLSAIETAPAADFGTLNDGSRPLRERLAEFGRIMATDESGTVMLGLDQAGLAVSLEFVAALLRNPRALQRYSAELERRLVELAAEDEDQPSPDITPVQAWAIGHALLVGLQIYRFIAPEIVTPAAFERACELLAGLYLEADGD
jgi:AcrR family transcriptional regulator